MEILWLKHHGFTHDRISTLAGVSRSTVQRCLDDYLEGGLERIREVAAKESHSDLDDHRVSLEEYFTKHPPRSVKEARTSSRSSTAFPGGKPRAATSCTPSGSNRAKRPAARFRP